MWQAQFLSCVLQILGEFVFFEDVQIIGKSVLDIFNGTKVTKNPKVGPCWSSPWTDTHIYSNFNTDKIQDLFSKSDSEFHEHDL